MWRRGGVIDATDKVLGRIATEVVRILRKVLRLIIRLIKIWVIML